MKNYERFNIRQNMIHDTFEIYRYLDNCMSEISLHHHDFFEVYCLLSGEVSYIIDNKTYTLKPNDILLISPFLLHQPVFHTKDDVYERIVLWLNIDFMKSLNTQKTNLCNCFESKSNLLEFGINKNLVAIRILETLLEEKNMNKFGSDISVEILLKEFFLNINRSILDYETNQDKYIITNELVRKSIDYINNNITRNFNIEDMANSLFVSKYYLSHSFKKYMGTSIYKYITHKRLALAKQVLYQGKTAYEAYILCGFGDYSNFYRAFVKEYGTSPKNFK